MSYALSPTLRQLSELDPKILAFWCPGCGCAHAVTVGSGVGTRWQWNGSTIHPTFEPSLLVQYANGTICRSYVKDGMIRYLSDCSHELRSQQIPIPVWPCDVPEWVLQLHIIH